MKIAVFGPHADKETLAIKERLFNRGVEAHIFDLARFPSRMSITFDKGELVVDSRLLSEFSSAFLRGRGLNRPSYLNYEKPFRADNDRQWTELHDAYNRFVHQETINLCIRQSVLAALSKIRVVVNTVRQNDYHRMKTYLLHRLTRAAASVPPFAAGTDKESLRAHARRALNEAEGVVQKPLAGIYKTHLWDEKMWRNHPWNERGALYQQYIQGDTIRCYVLDGEVVAAAKIVHGGTVDSSMSQTGIDVIELPEHAREQAINTAASLDLTFCGIDLMNRSGTGEYFVVDCNMSPMFVNFSRLSGIDIAAHIAEYLARRGDNESRKANKAVSLLARTKELIASDGDIREKMFGNHRGKRG
ncbi:MAG: hypothetical protein GF344_09125 [Chitinivibrionales bacterium]|nr:hypothetical protein [Chitinivibrionales bacterium]